MLLGWPVCSISASELKQLMISFGHKSVPDTAWLAMFGRTITLVCMCSPTDEEIKETMAEADEDGNEEIEFEEFCILLLKKRTEVQALGELREAFNVRLLLEGHRGACECPLVPHSVARAGTGFGPGWLGNKS